MKKNIVMKVMISQIWKDYIGKDLTVTTDGTIFALGADNKAR